ncbi:MAG TPA: PsbP-related protein [Candidatus Bathyarchaeia archaeon]|nr:PsbP-related protein [Candidatus Bathyarchaeia archaeon]
MKNKRALAILVTVVVLSGVFLIAATNKAVLAQHTTTANLLTYENSTNDMKLQYPSSWDKDLNVSSPDVVTFYPSAVNSNASLTVTVDDISDEKGISLAQYASDSNDAIKHETKDFKLLGSTTNNTLAGLPAYKSIYSYAGDNNSKVQGMEIGAIKGDKVYTFTYEAGPNEYYKYLPMVQQLIKSFQIVSSQPPKLL